MNTQHKQLSIAVKSAGAPSAEQLAAINGYALAELTADDVYVRTWAIAHNAIDRDREVMDEGLLAAFAATLPGKGLFIRHPSGWDGDSGPGEGRWFAAQVDRMSLEEARKLLREPTLAWPPDRSSAEVLIASAYIVRTEDNPSLLKKIDGGVVSDVSIGFRATGGTDINNADGQYIARRLHAPGEALEASLVWLGAQPGARAIKHAKDDPVMTEEQIKALRAEHDARVKALQDQVDAAKSAQAKAEADAATATANAAALVKALGEDHKALAADPEALARAAIDGKAYRTQLVDDIVAAERAKGMGLGDDADSLARHKGMYAGVDIATLKDRAEKLQVKGAGLNPGQPGTNRGGGEKVPAALDSAAIG